MTSLTKLREIRVYFILGTLTILLITAITLQLFLKQKGKTGQIWQNIEISASLPKQTTATKVNFLAEHLTIPREMSVIKLTPNDIDLDKSQELAKNLGFQQQPQVISSVIAGEILLWRSANATLSVDIQHKTLHFERIINYKQEQKGLVNLDRAVESLKKFLDNSKLDFKNFNIEDPQFNLYEKLSEGLATEDTQKAKYIELIYPKQINGFPVILKSQLASLKAITDYADEVLSLDLDLNVNAPWEVEFEGTTKPFDKIIKELNEDKGIYLSSIGKPFNSTQNNLTINTLTVTEAEIVYFEDIKETNRLVPTLYVKGETVLSDRSIEKVGIILPIINNFEFVVKSPNPKP
ncbi:hypothetical protein A3A48_03315 [Candidatus Curtissbacteria bacterium RIFCSPLOWO2_01_FULL_37_9]|uniref:Uncharacterized protein n=1 Tax=Candidatus Curtissbacteria bacterium RIFCSPLOWO2_01_FULL_37_9 TaxID=1797724 RepID=A0A1F5GR74_9BACT|nr:MAG: hypothetical protein A3A48_03315 [Candidatus Curtissbacteria bacterium RIFCSPLOWO2_01_FULL_37_9]